MNLAAEMGSEARIGTSALLASPRACPQRAQDSRFFLLKGLAIFGVAGVHWGGSFSVSAYAWSGAFFVGLSLNQLFSFAVPLFVFLSGWLLELQRDGSINWASFYWRRITKVVLPYAVVSVAYFYLFGHSVKLLSGEYLSFEQRAWWLFTRFFYYGIENVLYFVPLILQLYLLYPLFRALPRLISRVAWPESPPPALASVLTVLALLLGLHVALGVLCYQGTLDYYTYCRPFAPFWAVFFFAGMHFRRIARGIGLERKAASVGLALGIVTVVSMAWNFTHLLNPMRVGESFENAQLVLAYARPEILTFNLASISLIGLLLLTPWRASRPWWECLGKHSYTVYLWHLAALYYLGWRHSSVIAACLEAPMLIVVIPFAVSMMLALIAELWLWLLKETKRSLRRLVSG